MSAIKSILLNYVDRVSDTEETIDEINKPYQKKMLFLFGLGVAVGILIML